MWRGDQSPYRGRRYQLARPLNLPQSLTRPHPPIMIGGGGERKTLRFVARYADACNLFPGPDWPASWTCCAPTATPRGATTTRSPRPALHLDVGEKGEKPAEVIDQLGRLAELGFQVAIGAVANVWQVTPLEVIAADVIPAVARL